MLRELCSLDWFIFGTSLLAIPDVDPSLVGILNDLEEEQHEGVEARDASNKGQQQDVEPCH